MIHAARIRADHGGTTDRRLRIHDADTAHVITAYRLPAEATDDNAERGAEGVSAGTAP